MKRVHLKVLNRYQQRVISRKKMPVLTPGPCLRRPVKPHWQSHWSGEWGDLSHCRRNQLTNLVREYKASGSGYKSRHTLIRSSYGSHYRRMLPKLPSCCRFNPTISCIARCLRGPWMDWSTPGFQTAILFVVQKIPIGGVINPSGRISDEKQVRWNASIESIMNLCSPGAPWTASFVRKSVDGADKP